MCQTEKFSVESVEGFVVAVKRGNIGFAVVVGYMMVGK